MQPQQNHQPNIKTFLMFSVWYVCFSSVGPPEPSLTSARILQPSYLSGIYERKSTIYSIIYIISTLVCRLLLKFSHLQVSLLCLLSEAILLMKNGSRVDKNVFTYI